MTIAVSALYVYPVKSCRGIALTKALLDSNGIEHDRSWLLINQEGVAITQRDCARLAQVSTEIIDGQTLRLAYPGMDTLTVCRTQQGSATQAVVWNDNCKAIEQAKEASLWFSKITGIDCRLVIMSDDFVRPVDNKYATGSQQVGFADGFPFLLLSVASLEDLNSKLEVPVPMNRFRPNIVVSGSEAYEEDKWAQIEIAGLRFDVVKPCARCVMTTIDQEFGLHTKEPLRTLSAYRKVGNKVMFGQNLVHHSSGILSLGDEVQIIELKK